MPILRRLPRPRGAQSRRPGRRFARPGAGDVRLWLGIGLLVAAGVGGAVLLGDRSEDVVVLRAVRPLSVGAGLADLQPVAVPAAIAAGYLRPGDVVGGTLRWPVAAGDLVPRAAVDDHADARRSAGRSVTVPVDPQHSPPGLAAGDLVDVWATVPPNAAVPQPAGTRAVIAAVPVVDVGADAGFGGAFAVTLLIPQDQVRDVVQAARGSVVDLVAVPVSAQTPAMGVEP